MPGLMNDWELAGNKNRWVCPSDRHLALRAKLRTGWSVRTQSASSPGGSENGSQVTSTHSSAFTSPSSAAAAIAGNGPLTEGELDQIKNVLARAEQMERQEQERVGKLVDKIDRMKRIATGNGVTQCMLCGAEFGLLGPRSYAAMCHDCRKYVCQKNCGVDTVDANHQAIFLCKICSEAREMWKKSGAWFYHGVPKYVLPPTGRAATANDQRGGATNGNGNAYQEAGGSLMPNWVSSKRSASPNGSESPEARCRAESAGRRRLPATPDYAAEYNRVPSPQPRWALNETNRKPANGGRAAASASRYRRHCSSSEEEEDENEQADRRGATGRSQWSSANRQQHQWQGGVQRIVTRCRRFTESSSGSEDRSDEEGGNGERSERSASPPSTPRGSVLTPSSTHETADGAAPTMIDTSDSKSIDSGVVRSDRSQSVTRPASLVPSSPSGGSGQQSMPQQPLQPPTPQFHQSPQQHQLQTAGAVLAQRRASEALQHSQAQQQFLSQQQLGPQHMEKRRSIGGPGDVVASAAEILSGESVHRMSIASSSNAPRPSSPDLPSSPDDDQSSLGTLEFSVVFDAVNQNLTVLIIRAKNLKAMDSNGFSDPYVKLHLLPGAAKSTKQRTKTIYKTLNPDWNETIVYYGVTEEDRLHKTLRLTVLDEDRFRSDFLGETRVQLKRLAAGKEKTFNVYLEKQMPLEKGDELAEERGKIQLGLTYNGQKQCLVVEVIRCSELIGMDPNGYSDPYVKIALLPEADKKHRVKTKVKKKTLNPAFNEEFSIPVPLAELAKKTLEVTVWDKDVGKHDDYIGGLQLGIESKGERLRHWYDCIKNPGTKFRRWHKLAPEKFERSASSH